MKAFSSRLLHWLAVIGCTAAQEAFLYNLDIKPQAAASFESFPIDSETANAILARRLDATRSRTLGPVDDIILEHLDRYGGQRTFSLFGDNGASDVVDRLIVAIEGYDGEPMPASPGIRIERADTSLASVPYVKDLLEHHNTGKSSCNGYTVLKDGTHITYLVDLKGGPCAKINESVRTLGHDSDETVTVIQNLILETLQTRRERGSRAFFRLDMARNQKSQEARRSHLKEVFNNVHQLLERQAREGQIESTILLLPSRRAPPTLNLNRRQSMQEEEEPLSQPFVTISPSSIDPSSSFETSTSNSTQPLPPLGSFLPACFPTNSTCTESTNSCSGHGFCYAKSSKCFTCRCGSTIVRQDDDGKNVKTVQWGGSACERKDVSMPFFLFAGFGVFMTALVVGAVGMLYGMGSEELPSVIGAGVTGPRAQR